MVINDEATILNLRQFMPSPDSGIYHELPYSVNFKASVDAGAFLLNQCVF